MYAVLSILRLLFCSVLILSTHESILTYLIGSLKIVGISDETDFWLGTFPASMEYKVFTKC